ncbi:YjfB family protein [Natranaerobius trueperi]|uniref:Motility protein n=1 Tax=Natranaerobius trueperi TaxID=759412 RepID=A0A226C2I9_9FIRM|nr:YjfB family protein [Natranaerobius trueperi]OWZ84834.1 hypothetical protein CDO51_00040 [Natranaerobius trueperi]
MDIPALAFSLSQTELFNQVNTSVAKMSLDNLESSKDQFMDLLEKSTLDRSELENSIQTHLGNNLDIML